MSTDAAALEPPGFAQETTQNSFGGYRFQYSEFTGGQYSSQSSNLCQPFLPTIKLSQSATRLCSILCSIAVYHHRVIADDRIIRGIIKFSLVYLKDIKKITKNPTIKWKKPECPRQSQQSLDCGYYICRYMLETIEKR
ncbi:hypothetical protein BVRB_9g209740 [Beta vulgaris subsp. vulgaris]|nr:hypothetical protein BVRB_9g209740 [Beta vulgaris subsp. vulgaris]